LVGRDDVLVRFDLALAQAAAGQGSVLLLYGEAGIGKTRLCGQVGRTHRDRGGQALLGRAVPEKSTIAFAAVADTLRAARRAEPPLWEAAKARADLLCLIAPELSAWAEGGRSRPADHPVLFEALLDAVEESTRGEQATLWVLDDVHWADDATWDFVRYAARRVGDMSLVLAVTYRDEEIGPASPRWTGLVRLQREPHVQALPVRRLASADAGRLVGALAPTVPPEVVARIVERSAGTPLLIEELARLAGSSGDLPAVPDIVRATVRGRAAHLGPAGRELLDVAALVGLAVEARTLELLRPGSSAAELVEVGLLDTDGGDYRFHHPLLWEAALAEVPAGRRRALHQELAAALAADGGYPAERVAGHLQRAGQPEAALAALEQGADAADATGDVGRCAGLYLAAFRLARTQPALDHRSPALEHEAIRHLFRARRWTELDPLIRDAWSRRDRMSEEERAWLAMPLAWHLYSQGRVAESWELIQQELAHLERAGADGDVPSLHSQAGYLAWLRGEPELARWHVERGLEAARRGADSEAVWWARHHRIHVGYRLTGDRGAAVRAFRDNAAAARAQGITDGEALAMWDLACHSARPEDIAAGLLAAERAGAGSTMQDLRVLEGALLLLEGHADDAESRFVRFGSRIRAGEPVAAPWIDLNLALLYLHRGELDAARTALHGPASATEAAQTEYHAADRAAALGWLAWELGRWADAAAHLDRSTRLWRTGCWHPLVGGPIFLPLHVDALLRQDRKADAAAVLEQAPVADRQARFYAAGLAAARFRLDPNRELAAAAESLASSAPWPWLCAVARLWRGELLGDAEAAGSAVVLFEDLGNPPGVTRAERVLRRLGVRQPARQRPTGPLSERETEVAQLVAEGLTNAAIAARLYLSRPTVASHVAHILTKLGFSSRAQIAAWVAAERR
jgi:DNA-binding CsgD family transcriptional regulator